MMNLMNAKGKVTKLLLALTFSCFAVNQAEAGSWSPPVDLSAPGEDALAYDVAVDLNGNSTVDWMRFDGSNYIIQASTSSFGGGWSAPVDLSASGEDAFFPKVVADSQGNATAIWARSNGTNFIAQSSSLPFGGSWSAPVDLSAPGASGQDATSPQLAVDGEGNVTAVWYRNDGTNNIIQSASLPVGGSWSSPVDLTIAQYSGQGDIQPQVAVDPAGNAIAVWVNDPTGTIRGAIKPFGGSWSEPMDISDSGSNVGEPQIAIDAYGNATVVWTRSNGSNDIIQTSSRPHNGSWSVPVDLSASGQDAFLPQLAVDLAKNVIVVWQRSNGLNSVVQAATKGCDGSWSAPFDLSALGEDASEPQVKVGQTGTIVAVWKRSNGTNLIIQGTSKSICGLWQPAVALSAAGQDALSPRLGVDKLGNATAIWQRSNGANAIVQSSFGTIFPDLAQCCE